jgi:fatty acid desaturase
MFEAARETSTNFSMNSRFLFWVTGGLTHQIEHHTFPDIHPHFYPEISVILQEEFKKVSRWGPFFRHNTAEISRIILNARDLGSNIAAPRASRSGVRHGTHRNDPFE